MSLVTVIIPVHKTISYLKECVDSVLKQTHKHLEIIIACNGTINAAACKLFLDLDDDRLLFINTQSGRHNARNEALQIANGTFIQYLDYDDLLLPNKISSQLELIETVPHAIAICKWKKFSKSMTDYYKFPFDEVFVSKQCTATDLIVRLGIKGAFIATGAYLFHIDIARKGNWIDSPNDDSVYFSELCKYNPSIFFSQEVFVGYRMHTSNASTVTSKEQLDLLINGWQSIETHLKHLNRSEKSGYLFKAYAQLMVTSRRLSKYRYHFLTKKMAMHANSFKDFKLVIKAILTSYFKRYNTA